jgi:hypothetical protein
MTKRSILAAVALAAAVGLTACGESDAGDNGGTSGSGGAGGTGGTGGTAGTAGAGGMGEDECNRVCESPCTQEVLPIGTVDDCIRACRMGLFTCVPETIAALECLETIDCGATPSDACIPQSAALTRCLGG